MKKTVFVFGLIAGLIVSAVMAISIALCYKSGEFEGNMLLGYASMIVAFAFIFVAVKNYRDKLSNGTITFGKAFLMGLYIALIGSTMYVVTWLIGYYIFFPDFMERFTTHVLEAAKKGGATAAELKQQADGMAFYKDMYQTPFGVIFLTYMEVFPVGLIVALITALILKKKPAKTALA